MAHAPTSHAMPDATQHASSSRPAGDSRVQSVNELVAHFERGIKSTAELRVGLEHEKIGVALDADGTVRPLPYEDAPGRPQIRELLRRLGETGWQPVQEASNVIALRRSGATVTLEPGGQFELSGRPQPTEGDCTAELDAHLHELLPLAESMGIAFLATGFRPLGTWDDVPYMPKGRYRVMREYLPTRGKLGVEMMKRTATVQANLDYMSEVDAIEKLRLSISLQALVTAMYAASPLVDGKPSGYKSFRAACWLDTDPDRCGLLPFLYKEEVSFRDYAEWALDVQMFFVRRHHRYVHVPGLTFRRFMAEGWQGERATREDWDLHLSTLFPDTRLRQYVEVRGADSGPMELMRALPCLWRGMLYTSEGRRAAWDLVKDWTYEEREALRRDVPRLGMEAQVRGQEIGALCVELVRIAQAGLTSLGSAEGVRMLEPLLRVAVERRAPCEDILDAFHQAGGDARAFAERIRYRL